MGAHGIHSHEDKAQSQPGNHKTERDMARRNRMAPFAGEKGRFPEKMKVLLGENAVRMLKIQMLLNLLGGKRLLCNQKMIYLRPQTNQTEEGKYSVGAKKWNNQFEPTI